MTRKKLDFLREVCSNDNSLMGLCLNETWYQEQSDTEVGINGFKVYRADRLNREGGGAAIYVANNFSVNQKKVLSYSNGTCEAAGVLIEKENIALLSLYRPPKTISYKHHQMLKSVKEWLSAECNGQTEIIVYGDFNFRFLKWKKCNPTASVSNNSQNLTSCLERGSLKNVEFQIEETLEFMASFYLEQKVSLPSRGMNYLDIMFTNSDSFKVNDVRDVHSSISDHRIIEWSVDIDLSSTSRRTQSVSLIDKNGFDAFDFRSLKTDWEKVCSELTVSMIKYNHDETIDCNLIKFYDICRKAMMKAGCPQKSQKKNFKRIPSDRKRFMRKMGKIKKRLSGCLSQQKKEKYTAELVELEWCIQKSLHEERIQMEDIAVSKINSDPKYFFSYAQKYNTANSAIGPLKDANGELTHDETKMANLLNEQFNSVFNVLDPNDKKTVCLDDDPSINSNSSKYCGLSTLFSESASSGIDINFSKEKVEKAIDKMKRSSSPGPDMLPALFFKETKCCISEFLAAFMHASFSSSHIPQILKDAFISPIPKGGDTSETVNYRPISLTCHIIKIMERIVAESIVEFLATNDILSSKQHGFRSNYSTLSELLVHYSNVVDALDNNNNYDAIMLDYSKAFDSVSHSLLLYKLKEIGITGSVGKWIGCFLLGRRQKVKVGGHFSEFIKVLSGVPQGTILGPLLFILFINDIYEHVSTSNLSSYADDTKLGKCISSANSLVLLQNDLKSVVDWSINNQLAFNYDKVELLRFKSSSDPSLLNPYLLENGDKMKEVSVSKDLGVKFDNDGSFSTHIEEKVKKASKISGYIFRTFLTRHRTPLIRMLKTLVIPIIEYGSVLWNPADQHSINCIEAVQQHYTAKIAGLQQLDYWERLKELKLYSLERRRERYIILYVFKIVYGIVPNPGLLWIDETRRGRCIEYVSTHNRNAKGNKLRKNSFLYTAYKLFNCLPANIRNFNGSMLSVKTLLDNILCKIPDEPRLNGYTMYSRAPNNSIVTQILYINYDM